jgi:hypothetical protein
MCHIPSLINTDGYQRHEKKVMDTLLGRFEMAGRYLVSINGFRCINQTWDDPLEFDGKGDEVRISTLVRIYDGQGNEKVPVRETLSEEFGDTNGNPNRVRAGSARGGRGGLQSGDKFPDNPVDRQTAPTTYPKVPPYVVWEGDLPDDGTTVLITPSIWEWDPGDGVFNTWVKWQVDTDAKFGKRAKEIVGKMWPVVTPIFDAVALGIQTIGTIPGFWAPGGQPGPRPIGCNRDPSDPDGILVNTRTIALNAEMAEYILSQNLDGIGNGKVEAFFKDDPHLAGAYSIILQVDRIGPPSRTPAILQWDWRWCRNCHGLFYGPQQSKSVCPIGGAHMMHGLPEDTLSYGLLFNQPASPKLQTEWRYCDKCQGLFYGPGQPNSVCPTGGRHAAPSNSYNYGLPLLIGTRYPGLQEGWYYCSKCQGLFSILTPSSRCPAGHEHTALDPSPAGTYYLPVR